MAKKAGFERLDTPRFPNGISMGTTPDGEFLVLDFLTHKVFSTTSEHTETVSFSSVVLSKAHLKYLKESIENFLNDSAE